MRKRFDFLLGRSRQQSREEAKACGACLEPTELDVLLEEMSEREKLAESTRESVVVARAQKQIAKKPKRSVAKPWKELVKLKEGLMKNERTAKRQRRSGADVTEFLWKKSEKELKIRQEELALKAGEVENEKEKQARC